MKFKIDFNAISEKNVQVTEQFIQEHGLTTESKSIPQLFCNMLDSCSEMVNVPLSAKFVRSLIRIFNFENYFKGVKVPDEVYETMNFELLDKFIDENWASLEPDVKQGVLVTKKARRKQWFDRARPYLNSHIIGTSDKNSLNQDKRFKYQAKFDEGSDTVTFSLKNEPKTNKK